MPTRFNGWLVGGFLVALAVAGAIVFVSTARTAGQTTGPGRTADGKPDLSGIWQANNEANWDLQAHSARAGMVTQPGVFPSYDFARVPAAPVVALGAAAGVPGSLGVVEGDGQIPYKPEAAEIKRQNADHWIDRDPELKCYLPGIPRAMYMPYPFAIVQGKDKIHVTYAFSNAGRVIHLNRVEGPPDDTFMGHSVGRWEGDTLVVDAIAFKDKTWLDTYGLEYSEKLHLIERFQKTDANTLRWTVTVEDPVFFTHPFKYAFDFKRQNTRILSYDCGENEKDAAYMKPTLGGTHHNKKVLKFPN